MEPFVDVTLAVVHGSREQTAGQAPSPDWRRQGSAQRPELRLRGNVGDGVWRGHGSGRRDDGRRCRYGVALRILPAMPAAHDRLRFGNARSRTISCVILTRHVACFTLPRMTLKPAGRTGMVAVAGPHAQAHPRQRRASDL